MSVIAGLASPWTIIRIIACVPLVFALYVVASFFLPLRLPDAQKRADERAAVLRRLEELYAEHEHREDP